MAKKPVLSQLVVKHGEAVIVEGLIKGFVDMTNVFKLDKKIEPHELAELSKSLIKNRPYLKADEIKVFWDMAKNGKFGEAYGRLDLPTINVWLDKFEAMLSEEMEKQTTNQKHLKIDETNKNVKGLVEKFKELGLPPLPKYKVPESKPIERSAEQVEIDERVNKYFKDFDLLYNEQPEELRGTGIRLITYEGERIDVTTYINKRMSV